MSVATIAADDSARAWLGALGRSSLFDAGGADALHALEASPDGLVLVDRQRRILYVNERATALTGYSRRDTVGRPCAEGLHFVTCGDRCALFGEETVCRRSCVLERRDGSHLELTKSAQVLRDGQGHVVGGVEALSGVVGAASASLRPLFGGAPRDVRGFVAVSEAMRGLLTTVERLASSDVNVLVTGESGVGKEVVARALHALGSRRAEPFHAINCAALNETLLESELFGHERGAFTGAVQRKVGRLELCGRGTLLLDEIGCLSPCTQAKLLRVLEDRTFERVGGTRPQPMAGRVVAATNADLEDLVARGRFRADLYYRLKVIGLEVPPLRDRPVDVLPLAWHFARSLREETRAPFEAFSAHAEAALKAYPWPGNVRELRNAVLYALTLGSGPVVALGDLPPEVQGRAALTTGQDPRAEEGAIREALERSHYGRARAAEILGLSRTTLWRKMRRLGIA